MLQASDSRNGQCRRQNRRKHTDKRRNIKYVATIHRLPVSFSFSLTTALRFAEFLSFHTQYYKRQPFVDHDSYCQLEYTLQAYMKRHSNLIASIVSTVESKAHLITIVEVEACRPAPRDDLLASEYCIDPSTLPVNIRCYSIGMGHVLFGVRVDRTTLAPGHKVHLTATGKNESRIKVQRLPVKILEKLAWKANGHHWHARQENKFGRLLG
jgi:hypothetical protein